MCTVVESPRGTSDGIYCREETPKPTTALDYTYGRRSRGANLVSAGGRQGVSCNNVGC